MGRPVPTSCQFFRSTQPRPQGFPRRASNRKSLSSRLLLYFTLLFTALSLDWTLGAPHVRWLTEECEFWVPQLVGLGFKLTCCARPPPGALGSPGHCWMGWEPVFGGASGDLDIAWPSHPEVIMKKDCGMRGRGAKEAHVFGAAALCLRRVVTTRERISTE